MNAPFHQIIGQLKPFEHLETDLEFISGDRCISIDSKKGFVYWNSQSCSSKIPHGSYTFHFEVCYQKDCQSTIFCLDSFEIPGTQDYEIFETFYHFGPNNEGDDFHSPMIISILIFTVLIIGDVLICFIHKKRQNLPNQNLPNQNLPNSGQNQDPVWSFGDLNPQVSTSPDPLPVWSSHFDPPSYEEAIKMQKE